MDPTGYDAPGLVVGIYKCMLLYKHPPPLSRQWAELTLGEATRLWSVITQNMFPGEHAEMCFQHPGCYIAFVCWYCVHAQNPFRGRIPVLMQLRTFAYD
jgi:hypothetical protein